MLVTFQEPSPKSTGVGNGKWDRRLIWLSSNLLLELRHQRKICGHGRQEQDHMGSVHHSEKNICEPKILADFQLTSAGKDNEKGFLKEVNSTRTVTENTGLFLDEVGYFPQRDRQSTAI